MKYQCNYCYGHGVYRIKRNLGQRLLRQPSQYQCQDCGTIFSKKELEPSEKKTDTTAK